MTSHNLRHELDTAVSLARQAGELIMGWYRRRFAVEYKGGEEPVTAADRAADELIRERLHAHFPEDGLLTEEGADDLSRLDKERVWIADPLDGTTEFIARTGQFAVQIALTVGGRPVLGVVYQPVTGLLYYALEGRGAHRVGNGQARRLHASMVADLAQMCMVASRSHYSNLVEAARIRLGVQSVRRLGSVGLKAGQVAEGICDLYVATKVAKEWDICAPHALLLEAGGVLTNLCGEPLVYNRPDLVECRGLVGSNGLVHDRIVKVLASLLEAER